MFSGFSPVADRSTRTGAEEANVEVSQGWCCKEGPVSEPGVEGSLTWRTSKLVSVEETEENLRVSLKIISTDMLKVKGRLRERAKASGWY